MLGDRLQGSQMHQSHTNCAAARQEEQIVGKITFQCTRYCTSVSEIITPIPRASPSERQHCTHSPANSLDLEMVLKAGLQRKKQQDICK